jgi:hypothetical protein
MNLFRAGLRALDEPLDLRLLLLLKKLPGFSVVRA